MDLYEYQGKQLFARFGIPVSDGRVAFTPDEARAAAAEIGGPVVVKAQVLVGGRGKAGGIKLAATPEEAAERAGEILGLDIRGHVVRTLWIEQASDIEREYYFSITFDRGAKRPLFMLTTSGGVDIEEVAEKDPDAIARLHVDPLAGWHPWVARELCFRAGIPAAERKQVMAIIEAAYRAFREADAMLVEINPLIVTPAGEVRALDSKFTVDDNALMRHPDIAAMRDLAAADPQEQMAREKGLTYVKLDGEVGILGNGAGLVMSTLDVVAQAGGRAANFLDVGGGAQAQEIVDALEVITSDPKVRAILFNIFGGITRCDEVAQGILDALDGRDIGVPMVVRLDGTSDEEGRKLLADANPPGVYVERTMLDAARRAVELAGDGRLMAILVTSETRLVVQGITGREGSFHATRNRDYGTAVVAGVTPGKGGQDVSGIPVFDTVAQAVEKEGANTSMVFVPPPFAADAIYEAVDAGCETVICITEGIPAHDMMDVYAYIRSRGVTLLGPNCPGALSPEIASVGIIPTKVFRKGPVGLVSRSGTLTYQIGNELAQAGVGNSTIVGIGGDPIVGSSFIDILERFEDDPQTELVVMVGEIGGAEEERAAEFIADHMSKPVVAYIAGFTAPPGKTMGHAGAIISGSSGTAQAKKEALEARGIRVGTNPTEAAQIAAERVRST